MTEHESQSGQDNRPTTKPAGLIIGVLLVAAIACVVLLRPSGNEADNGKGQDGQTASQGFHEAAAEAGLTFRMGFLPDESGTTFKINLYDHGCGVSVADYDGDGYEDVLFLNQLGSNALFRNRGDGTFVDVTKQAGVGLADRVCVGGTFADVDNDGDQDLYITSTRGGNVFFENQGGGKLVDATRKAGLSHVGHSQTAVFFDYDNDGLLDLFLVHTADWTLNDTNPNSNTFVGKGGDGFDAVISSAKEYNILYRNKGDGTFENVTEQSGLAGRGWSSDVAIFDYDQDNDLDVLIACMFGRAQLYNNDGGTFRDVTLETLGRSSWGGMGVKVFDAHNDNRLDALIVDMHSDMWMGLDLDHGSLSLAQQKGHTKYDSIFGPLKQSDQGLEQVEKKWADTLNFENGDVLFGNSFFRATGQGSFEECSEEVGLETWWPWGIAVGDYNNDGFQDLFLASGMGFPFYYWPNRLLINDGTGSFEKKEEEYGIEPPTRGIYHDQKIQDRDSVRSSRCAATADFDGDGRLEIITNNFNDTPYFFRNNFPVRNYLALKLQGTRSNRDAIGTRVTLHTGDETMLRLVQSAGGYLSQSSRILHFGLGDRRVVDRIEIAWTSGTRQIIDKPAINQRLEVVEPDDNSTPAGDSAE